MTWVKAEMSWKCFTPTWLTSPSFSAQKQKILCFKVQWLYDTVKWRHKTLPWSRPLKRCIFPTLKIIEYGLAWIPQSYLIRVPW